ncbi:MAG: single-stranded-DNA-specific exonuclease RecJ [Lentisphaeria bacterium]|nr:single-stranded-DNA-specific exonuclease RecJ [Lentisphaeria bacterium]
MGTKLWISASEGKENTIQELVRNKRIPRAVALYLAARGIGAEEVDAYFYNEFADLSDPYRFPGMDIAVRRLWQAIRNRERILIHGDYDTDGITATSLLSWVLEKNGAVISSFLPHRFDDGYGFTPESLVKALESAPSPCKVLVTVDCGINSNPAVEEASARGIDVIITDHHEPGDTPSPALAILNPKLNPELADMHQLSGVGVAFKLAHAFIKYGRENNLGGYATELQDVLDFVALGTVADIVPLLGENRILVKYGMETLRKQLRPGIRALIEVSHVDSSISPSDITFKLAPRINAAGRLGNANTALELLNASNIVDAYRYADMLESFNQRRQAKEQEIFSEAKRQVESLPTFATSMTITAAGKDWHQGVIGIVASRFARDYNRPAIVLTIQGDEAHGSGRSIPGVNLIKILSKSSHLLTRYGGHPMAVGLGLPQDKIAEFQKEFEQHVREEISPCDINDSVTYDGTVDLSELGDDFFALYPKLGPFGHGNPQPSFRLNHMEIVRTFPIKAGHTKGIMRDMNGDTTDFIAFNMVIDPKIPWDVIALPHINEYYGEKRRQLQILDAKPAIS